MGFGSYDESEQENQSIDADIDAAEVGTNSTGHGGDVDFENGAPNDELLDRLEDIKN